MQTERVTFLTTPDHKAALDAFARESGMSVGHVAREATSRFIAEPRDPNADERELAALTEELEQALPDMRADFDAIVASLRSMNEKMEAYRAERDKARHEARAA